MFASMPHGHMTGKHIPPGYAYRVVEGIPATGHSVAVQNLRRIRDARGLTQSQLAEKVGANQATISKIERGDEGVTLGMINRIAKALGVAPVTLFGLPDIQQRAIEALDRMPPDQQEAAAVVLDAMSNRMPEVR